MKELVLSLFLLTFSETVFSSTMVCTGDYHGPVEITLDISDDILITNVSVLWRGQNTLTLQNQRISCQKHSYTHSCEFEVDVLPEPQRREFPSSLDLPNLMLSGHSKTEKARIILPDVMFDDSMDISCETK